MNSETDAHFLEIFRDLLTMKLWL